jgi:RNA polymerase sigma factor (sigma-70 family)
LRGAVGIPAVGIDAMPPPASGLPARLVLGPALRAQPDRRLVRLVREGYESAFEEIVRRYRRPLDRFAAGIVGGRSEDVTQDSFRKALEALRRGEAEVELRPWLYRIVRNTALNDLRDRPPAAAELAEELVGGGRSAAAEAEERAEIASLTARLRALPEKQRAALVMRGLEGMSHEEIAAALGISGGAARQAIARARTTVRSGSGALVPLPLLRALAGSDGAAEAGGAALGGGAAAGGAAIGGGAAAGGSAVAGGGAALVGGGFGAGAVKVGLATIAIAGSLGAGVALQHHGADRPKPEAGARPDPAPGGPAAVGVRSTPSPVLAVDDLDGRTEHELGDDHRHGGRGQGDDRESSGHGDDPRGGTGRSGGHGSDGGGSRHGSGGSDGGSGHDGRPGSGSTSGGSSGSSASGSGGHGSDDTAGLVVANETAAPTTSGSSESSASGTSSGSSGGSGSDDSSSSGGESSPSGSELTVESSGGDSGSSGGSDSSQISP